MAPAASAWGLSFFRTGFAALTSSKRTTDPEAGVKRDVLDYNHRRTVVDPVSVWSRSSSISASIYPPSGEEIVEPRLGLRRTRTVALALTWMSAVVSLSAVINLALQATHALSTPSSLPQNTTPNSRERGLNTSALAIPTVISILHTLGVLLASSLFLVLLLPAFGLQNHKVSATRLARAQAYGLGGLSLVGFANQIALAVLVNKTSLVAGGSGEALGSVPAGTAAKVVGKEEMPGQILSALLLMAMLPFAAFVPAVVSAGISFAAVRRADAASSNSEEEPAAAV
ncbi:hypothetical protein MKEN_00751600 [Mycena kentingensis (nom. inval.)]|nr:hypothetical protein MKEN_00751600 [Mycena kentingensis (nom. inval.)]